MGCDWSPLLITPKQKQQVLFVDIFEKNEKTADHYSEIHLMAAAVACH